MNIEKFEWKEINSIITIENESFEKDRWDEIEFMKWYEKCKNGFLVAKENNEIIGYIIIEEIEARNGYIRSIAVKPNHRNKGIGRSLIESAIKNLELEEITLHVRAGNKAVEFYKKLGFKETQRFAGAYNDGEDAIYMSLKLNHEQRW